MKKINNKGFTLVELITVIVILAIILVIAYPYFGGLLENSKNKSKQMNISNIKTAAENYIKECELGTIEACFKDVSGNYLVTSAKLKAQGFLKTGNTDGNDNCYTVTITVDSVSDPETTKYNYDVAEGC